MKMSGFVPIENGRVIKIVQPAYKLPEGTYKEAKEMLESRGLELSPNKVVPGYGKLSDVDGERISELEAAFCNPEIGAIIIGHGGYGCLRMIENLDWDLVAENPKPIIGYSDATAILLPMASVIGSNAVHGPTVNSLARDKDEASLSAIASVVSGDWKKYNTALTGSGKHLRTLRKGSARGKLLGGNLTMIAALCGTIFLPKTEGSIIFFEDWNEPHYRIDRMLTQLKLSGFFENISGLAIGQFQKVSRVGEDIAESIEKRILELIPEHIPVVSNFQIGHGKTNISVLLNAMYELNENGLKLISAE